MWFYPPAPPPVPPTPWIRHDPSTEKPFAAKDVPIVRDAGKSRIENVYPPARKSKTLAIGVACMIVAADDVFVVPVPTTLKVIGFFRPDRNAAIAADAKDEWRAS